MWKVIEAMDEIALTREAVANARKWREIELQDLEKELVKLERTTVV